MSPVLAGVAEPGASFAEPFLRRFEGKWSKPLGDNGLPSPTLTCALDPFAEAAVVANSIRARLKEGCAPEDIGVVVRDLSVWTVPMRTTFEDYGIPFSGVGAKEAGGSNERQALAVSDILRQGARADIGRWLSACGLESGHRVAIAMDAFGVRWADEIAGRIPDSCDALPLPAREGFGLIDGIPFNQRTVLSGSIVKDIRERGVAWCDAWDGWPEESTGTHHLEHLGRIFKAILQLDPSSSIWAVLTTVRKAIPHDESISRTGFIHMVAALVDQQAFIPMGGQGGGVAVLDATEARGRTFQHLYVLGLNRGQFPRVVREDPLLPEGARRALGQLVPDIRERRLGLDEERFLFAQLLHAGRQVHLSMSQRDVAGKALHPSSLVVNLQLHGVVDDVKPATVESLPKWKAGIWAALNSNSAGEVELGIPHSLYSIGAARAGWSGENEPYMGSIGRAVHPMDSRNRPVYVTAVEAVARCPWQAFLVRDLGIETRPDPWGELPAVNTHLLGRVVHAVIERVVSANRGEEEDGVLVPLQWPSAATLESWTIEAATECLMRDGFAWRGFARAVVEPVRTSIDLLREIDADLEGVLGGEVTGFCVVPNGPTIHYRADRVGQKEGRTVVTDFKLGRPPTTHKTPKTRREKIVEAVRHGKLLQGMLYACSDGDSLGRYLYLNAGFEYPQREFVFEKTDQEVRDALIHIVDEVSAARAVGAMFPRVSEAGADRIPSACEYCGVREACSVLDSGNRRRIMEAASVPGEVGLTQARARLWWRGSDAAE
jgi:RecB family exonuclease